MKFNVNRLEKFGIALIISIFIFILCRYIGDIIHFVNIFLRLSIDPIIGIKLDRVYSYRYTAPVIFFTIFLSFFFNSKIYKFYNILSRLLKKEKYTLVFLLLITIVIRLFFFLTTEYYDDDSVIRIWISQNVGIATTSGLSRLFPDYDWPPLHFWMISIAHRLLGDILIASRIVSLFFGVLSVFPFYFLVKEFSDTKAAFFSTLFFSLYGLHSLFSTAPYAEVPALFFVLMTLLFFLKYLKSNNTQDIIFAVVFLNLGVMLRVESCLLIPPLSFIIFSKTKKYKPMLIFCILSSIFLLVWLCFEYLTMRNPLYFLINAINNYADVKSDTSFLTRLSFWLSLKKIYYTPFVLKIIGVLGLVYFFPKRKKNKYAYIFLFILFFYLIVDLITWIFFQERHTLMVSVLFLPFVYFGFVILGDVIKRAYARISANPCFKESFILLLLFLATVFFVYTSFGLWANLNDSKDYHSIPLNVPLTVNWIKENSPEDTTVLISSDTKKYTKERYLFTILLRRAYKLSNSKLKIPTSLDPKFPFILETDLKNITSLITEGKVFYNENIFLFEEKEIYLVITPNEKTLSSCTTELVNNYVFECAFESPKNRICGQKSRECTNTFFRVYRIYKKDKI
jgi:4-amino-4-deoxy-L-arabinose transferase-like glycosyltransferase